MILALAAFTSIVLADRERNFGPRNRRPIANPSRPQLPRPAPVPLPSQNPAIPPRFVGEPRRVERQIDIASIFNAFKSVAAIPGNIIQGLGQVASAVPVALIDVGGNLATVPLSIFQGLASAAANTSGQVVNGIRNATANNTG